MTGEQPGFDHDRTENVEPQQRRDQAPNPDSMLPPPLPPSEAQSPWSSALPTRENAGMPSQSPADHRPSHDLPPPPVWPQATVPPAPQGYPRQEPTSTNPPPPQPMPYRHDVQYPPTPRHDATALDARPSEASVIGWLFLGAGIYSIIHSPIVVLTTFCFWPFAYFHLAVGIWGIVHGAKMINNPLVPPSKALAICFVIMILDCDPITMTAGIVALVLMSNPKVKAWYGLV